MGPLHCQLQWLHWESPGACSKVGHAESYKPASTDQAWLPVVPCLKSWTGRCCSQEGWKPDSQGCTVRNGLPSIDSKHAHHKGTRKKSHCQSNSCSSHITSTGPSTGNRPSFPTPSPSGTACPNVKLSPHHPWVAQPAQMWSCPHTIPEWHSLPKCEAVPTPSPSGTACPNVKLSPHHPRVAQPAQMWSCPHTIPEWHSLPKCEAVPTPSPSGTACPNVKLSPHHPRVAQPAQMWSCPHTIPEWHSLPKWEAVATDPSLASLESRDQRYL